MPMLPKKVLLAEDDVDDQTIFYEFLHTRTDLQLLPVAENGVQLLDYLHGLTADALPHLIVLDQNMPKSNGLETLETLKNDNRYAHIPVMLYSTYADQQLVEKGLKKGAALINAKPLTKEEYNQMMDGFLQVAGL